MLKGNSPAVIAENIRLLKQRGLSEAEATARAMNMGGSSPKAKVMHYRPPTSGRTFAVVTKDFSGLGWAKRLQDQGESVVLVTEPNPEKDADGKRQFDLVGEGWFPKMVLKEAMASLPDKTFWLFAENNFPKEADALRKKGREVFGTGAFNDRMEHDRSYAVEAAEAAGLKAPTTEEFKRREEGLKFLDEHEDTAYVLKPDSGMNYQTFVPEMKDDAEANRETWTYLKHLREEPGTYVLQERISGVELNTEVWMKEGEPFFSFVTLEAKRKNPDDMGEMAGCAGDLAWVVPVDSKIVKETVGRMFPHFKKEKYTGFADVNVILTDQGPRYLESCFDDQTEILTKSGWRLIKDVPVGTEVATLNRGTHRLEYQKTTDLIDQPYVGEMVQIGGPGTSVDCLSTPNHQMYVNRPINHRRNYEWSDVPAGDLKSGMILKRDAGWIGQEVDSYTIPAYTEWHCLGKHNTYHPIHHPEKSVRMGIWLRFLAWYLSEGSQDGKNVQIYQTKYRTELELVLLQMPFEYRDEVGGFRICSVQLASHLHDFGRCWEKFVPDYVKALSPRQIRVFLDEYRLGDGSSPRKSRPHSESVYFTTSPRMAGDLQELILKSGSFANISEKPTRGTQMTARGRTYTRNHNMFIISERAERPSLWITSKHLSRIPYAGRVYCVTVPNHTIYVRRNGKPLWVSNCCRTGYNSHPNLLLALTDAPLAEVLDSFTSGEVPEFKGGFGSSLTLFIDHPREGLPLHLDERWVDQWYPFDGYKEDDTLLLAGYSPEVGIFVDRGETPDAALQSVLHKLRDEAAVSFPDRYFRTDMAQTGYPNAVLDRVSALKERGLL